MAERAAKVRLEKLLAQPPVITEIKSSEDGVDTVQVEDVNEDEEDIENGNEMTDNTPETRVKVSLISLSVFNCAIRTLYIFCRRFTANWLSRRKKKKTEPM